MCNPLISEILLELACEAVRGAKFTASVSPAERGFSAVCIFSYGKKLGLCDVFCYRGFPHYLLLSLHKLFILIVFLEIEVSSTVLPFVIVLFPHLLWFKDHQRKIYYSWNFIKPLTHLCFSFSALNFYSI